MLEQAIAYLDCAVHEMHVGGDHTIFIGIVKAAGVNRPDESPLLYYSGKYRAVGKEIT